MSQASQYTNIPYDEFFRLFSQGALLAWVNDDKLITMAKKQWKVIEQFKSRRKIQCQIISGASLIHAHQNVSMLQLVCLDRPFITNSVFNAIRRLGLEVSLVQSNILELEDKGSVYSLWVEFDVLLSSDFVLELKKVIVSIYKDICLAQKDWRPMQKRLQKALATWKNNVAFESDDQGILSEVKAFIAWLNDYFTFLGVRSYQYIDDPNQAVASFVSGSGLGLLRGEPQHPVKPWLHDVPAHFPEKTETSQLFLFSKTNTQSTVHRSTYTDILVVRYCNIAGEIIGEERFIGLLTSDAYDSDPTKLPFIRKKVAAIVNEMSIGSRNANKTMLHLLKHLPRLELFQAGFEYLTNVIKGVLLIQQLHKIKLFIRKDTFERFYSCIIYCPRDVFNTQLKHQMSRYLMQSLNGHEYTAEPFFSEFQFAQLHVIIKVDPEDNITFNIDDLEEVLSDMSLTWLGRFQKSLVQLVSLSDAQFLTNRYQDLSKQYQNYYLPEQAGDDVLIFESLTDEAPLNMTLRRFEKAWHLKFFELGHSHIDLSRLVPILRHLGIKAHSEQSFELRHPCGQKMFLSDVRISPIDSLDEAHFNNRKSQLFDMLRSLILEYAFDDLFNRLVLTVGINNQEVGLLRAYAAYMRQIGFPLQKDMIARVLSKYADITRDLVTMFMLRFAPVAKGSKGLSRQIEERLSKALSEVDDFYDDQVLGMYCKLISATVRTNYFTGFNVLAFKLKTDIIPHVPKPIPAFDVFVFSEDLEGIYLRTSKVARGGIRWSSRHIDYRTEVLGLMHAQQVKNAIIVPSGAKGGFVCRKELKEGYHFEEGKRCYQLYIKALLSITDNRIKGVVKHPHRVKCYDGIDDYLVVAPDRGTGSFSDIANEIAKEHNFWLSDAFASGGSDGYDHKALAITAKSAWVSTKWHLKTLGLPQLGLSVVGIGDMSGDVFGNGLLLMKCRLKAAFNHQHIFLDPNPDIEDSYGERQRLFNLSRSSWSDYSEEKISKGGGIFPRHAKSIKLSAEVQLMLGLKKKSLSPNELIQSILSMSVDLIWNGGIGTYVRAQNESDEVIGDRQNDACRIEAGDLKARMIAEGGNLGLTQRARIEFAAHGGLLNTDYIDNSGGVDCSDHEVNVKMMLDHLMAQGLIGAVKRANMLRECEPAVEVLVLGNTLDQNIAISMAQQDAKNSVVDYKRIMQKEVAAQRLKRKFECLPSDEVMDQRLGTGSILYRPELAMLMCHMKNVYQKALIAEDSIFDLNCGDYLAMMLPQPLIGLMSKHGVKHPLHQSLIATAISNDMVNHLGLVFIHQIQDEFSINVSSIAKVYLLVRRFFNIQDYIDEVSAMRGQMSAKQELLAATELRRFLTRSCHWLLRNPDVMGSLSFRQLNVKELYGSVDVFLARATLKMLNRQSVSLVELGVTEQNAWLIARMGRLYVYLNVLAQPQFADVESSFLISLYNMIAKRMHLYALREKVLKLKVVHRWDHLQRSTMEAQLDECAQTFVRLVMKQKESKNKDTQHTMFKKWLSVYGEVIDQWDAIAVEVIKSHKVDNTMLSVAILQLNQLVRQSI